MKIFGAGFMAETNTFSAMPTTMSHFNECYLVRNGKHPLPPNYWGAPLVRFAELCKAKKWSYIESICAAAQPAGRLTKTTFETFKAEILNDLAKALPVNGVLLYLHGAMAAQDCDDCEGDLLASIRRIVGPKVCVAALFDPHTHLTRQMIDNSTCLIWQKEYPHTDFIVCAEQLFSITSDILRGKVFANPSVSTFDCHTINMYLTTIDPMKAYVEKLRQIERENTDVLSISVIHGFPWADIADIGTKIYVLTNNNSSLGDKLAKELGEELIAIREHTMAKFYSVDESLKIALANSTSTPTVIADYSDNTGIGAFGDSTFILEAMLKQKITNAAFGMLWDPIAVSIIASAGVGARLSLRIGGKMGPMSGIPLDVDFQVISVVKDLTIQSLGNTTFYAGTAVAINIAGIEVVLNDVRCQTYSTDCFTKLGINLLNKKIIVVKSAEHFRVSFSKISNQIIITAAPGAAHPDFTKIPYTKIKRPLWPLASK